MARAADKSAVAALAVKAMTCSRFYRDPMIKIKAARKVEREWVLSYYDGRRRGMKIVCEKAGRIVGFLFAFRDGNGFVIDLLAVSARVRREGVASRMMSYLADRIGPLTRLRVNTQLSNKAAMMFYKKNGFGIESIRTVFHAHGRHGPIFRVGPYADLVPG